MRTYIHTLHTYIHTHLILTFIYCILIVIYSCVHTHTYIHIYASIECSYVCTVCMYVCMYVCSFGDISAQWIAEDKRVRKSRTSTMHVANVGTVTFLNSNNYTLEEVSILCMYVCMCMYVYWYLCCVFLCMYGIYAMCVYVYSYE